MLLPIGLKHFQELKESGVHNPVPSVDEDHLQFRIGIINLIFPHQPLRDVGAHSTPWQIPASDSGTYIGNIRAQ